MPVVRSQNLTTFNLNFISTLPNYYWDTYDQVCYTKENLRLLVDPPRLALDKPRQNYGATVRVYPVYC